MDATNALRDYALISQRNEITEHHIYTRLARVTRDEANRRVLERIAGDEQRHAHYWQAHTGREVSPAWPKVWFFTVLGRLLGLTFAIKLMERGEEKAQGRYSQALEALVDVETIVRDEKEHEDALIAMLDEERLRYTGSIVLGLNDALVELTGALAGLTFALQNTRLIAMTGAITGIAAALSMAASEYLSTGAEEGEREPVKAALYTGIAYIFTVLALIFPYLVFGHYITCLAVTLSIGILIIAFFTYYISVARDAPFRRRFLEMAVLSLSVAAISFGIGFLLRVAFGIEV
ncbi:MAG: VIT1/CCC1 transporter family protein [Chloroflexi bacterium]|nr:VIT1/CCC1 transporter family protein [Chloroflexota bacterium]